MTKTTAKKYKRKSLKPIIAIRLDLLTPGLFYRKWGGDQCGKQGDWIVQSGREVYTIDAESFSRTYKKVSQGLYIKKTPVWAYRASKPGSLETKEGLSNYKKGDWVVANDRLFSDQYTMNNKKFRSLYEV